MNEKALEDLIVNWLTNHNQYELGDTSQYDTHYALDTGRLETFLKLTQPAEVEKSGIFHSPVNRRKFLERLRDEITKRGVVDVLRKGLKHQSNTFVLYNPLAPPPPPPPRAEGGARRKNTIEQVLRCAAVALRCTKPRAGIGCGHLY